MSFRDDMLGIVRHRLLVKNTAYTHSVLPQTYCKLT